MNSRPKLFTLIATIFCLLPMITISMTSMVLDLDFKELSELTLLSLEAKYIVTFWVIPIVSGISIMTMRRFSFALFVATQLYLFIAPIFFSQYIPELIQSQSLVTIYTIQCLSLFSIIYFSIHANRSYFFDPALRLWQRATRYHVPIPMSLKSDHFPMIIDATVLNLSSSGIFFILNQPHLHELEDGHKFTASISFQDFELSVGVKVVRKGVSNEIEGHGAKFQFLGLWSRFYMRGLIKEIRNYSKDHSEYIENQKAS